MLSRSIARGFFRGQLVSPFRSLHTSSPLRNSTQPWKQFEEKSQFMRDMRDLISEANRRKYNIGWLAVGAVGVLGFGGYGWLRSRATKEVSMISAGVLEKLLEDDAVQKTVDKFCADVVARLVASPEIKAQINLLLGNAVQDLAQQEYIKTELSNLFYYIFLTETVKQGGTELSHTVVSDLINKPEVQAQIAELLGVAAVNALQKDHVQRQLSTSARATVGSLFSWSSPPIPGEQGTNVVVTDVPE